MFLCCGDALFDMFVQLPSAREDDGDLQSVTQSDSVTLTGGMGGSPLNVAVGLARLGNESHYFTQFSNDIFGQQLRLALSRNHVDLSLSTSTNANTTLAIVATNSDGSARYSFYCQKTADVSIGAEALPIELPANIGVLHFGSYTTVKEPTASSLQTLARRESAQRIISYDPNLRLQIKPDINRWLGALNAFCACANVVKASNEDIASLFGPDQEEAFVEFCLHRGVQLVFITRGNKGASGYDATGAIVHRPGVEVEVVDTVGAGDTFQAAVLHWLVHNECVNVTAPDRLNDRVDLTACIDFAIRAAAITVSRRGADLPGLADINAVWGDRE